MERDNLPAKAKPGRQALIIKAAWNIPGFQEDDDTARESTKNLIS